VVEGEGASVMSRVRLMQPGEVFGSREMLIKSTHRMTTRAVRHVEVLSLSNADLSELLRDFPDIQQSVYQYALFKYNFHSL